MSRSYVQDLGLNQVKPEQTPSAASSDDGLGDSLDMYTNSTFDFLDADFGFDTTTTTAPAAGTEDVGGTAEKKVMDLFAAEDMFGDLADVVPGPFVGGYDIMAMPPSPSVQNNAFGASQFPMSPPAQFTAASTPMADASPATPAPKGRKKAATNPEAASAADEDKRRRNTAASARFRVKKKQHEQQLKDKTKELTEHALKLEERVRKLEMENELLRGLIIEKNGEGAASLAEGGMGFAV
ncbi:hypothetical protein P167DRAFT_537144 [Morchella conica CCBAS932]|uniref:BZIP domain-containing protein n=1 Tax=Morchella conica CCBAS932 TaxID=1392247 RepID=A0A3N4KNF3_9PEZI|nr:hypothetical protein P167DRAFT_537144 [Morchella conica CCBAS932]